jgi:hypothetical protein
MSGRDVIPAEFGEIYKKLGNHVAGALPARWQKAWVQAEIDSDNGMVACYYTTAGEATPEQLDELPFTVYKDFRDLQDAARRFDPKHVWTTATFTLQHDGTFKIDLGYEPIPIEAQYERRLDWEKKHLPPS